MLLIFNIFIYLLIYRVFPPFFVTARSRIAKHRWWQITRNYIFCCLFVFVNISLIFPLCLKHFHRTCSETSHHYAALFCPPRTTQFWWWQILSPIKRSHVNVRICDLLFFSYLVCCLSITFGWQPIHLKFIIHFCKFSKCIDWWSVFRGFALWN